ncbi:peptide/nickel transport system ATP-binding protein [Neomicrococcus aestuarii]|uniref:Peptide/nickel transport system ATP-binding protein n=1 Tax=Neomicrococcus aestuarii TaxID=556325 RepID=A0A7W8TTK3_9MICC|nr:ABC transporter ATP-binding protein [Neomicrococcus aestuarii]MBB5512664.1 peptide/nickel transport system ATP-binding protein [Neomicrococcus aestuarii]
MTTSGNDVSSTPNDASVETPPLLEIQNLDVSFSTNYGDVAAVQGASLTVRKGQTVAIVGESGSGKSTTAMAAIGLLAGSGRITVGSIKLDGQELTTLPESKLRSIRGRDIGMVPQDPMSNLNPVTKIGSQIAETLLVHKMATPKNVKEKVLETLRSAGVPNPEKRADQYPHELSGGLRQRALIAIGLACQPRLLIADEPTSALDVTVQQTILDQIQKMTAELGTAVLLITHDLGLAAERASELVVMHRGKVVETGPAKEILTNPQHPYTQSLVAAAPSVAAARLRPGAYSGTSAASSSSESDSTTQHDDASVQSQPAPNLVEVRDLTKIYPVRGSKEDFYAAKNVSFDVPRGSTVAIVGESGSGKTTTARMLLKLIEPSSGTMTFDGQDIATLDKAQLRAFRQRVQPVFQDPYSSLNPMFTVGRIIQEPLDTYKRGTVKERRVRVAELLKEVSLPPEMASRYPSELSGGQRQRVAIARALALQPDLMVCDEPVSALDVLVQSQILKLLGKLQQEFGLSYLFISHDLAVVRLISDFVCVMKDGEVVEAATSEEIFTNPRHPYTRQLLASIPGNELNIAMDPDAA